MKPTKVFGLVLSAATLSGGAVFALTRTQAQAANSIMQPASMRVVAIYPDYCHIHDASKHTVAGELIVNLDGMAFVATCNDGRSLELHPGK